MQKKLKSIFVIQTSEYERLHYALSMVTTSAALNNNVKIFFVGKAIEFFFSKKRMLNKSELKIESNFIKNGVANLDELVQACVNLKIKCFYCSNLKFFIKKKFNFMEGINIEESNISEIFSRNNYGNQIIFF